MRGGGFNGLVMNQDAKLWLEKASVSASLEGACATDKQMAQTKYQLGCVCWDLGLDSQVRQSLLLCITTCTHVLCEDVVLCKRSKQSLSLELQP